MNKKAIIIIFTVLLISFVFGAGAVLKIANENNDTNNNEQKEESSKIIEITSENFEKEVIQSDKTVLIDFYATWCQPCKILSPIVEEIAEERDDIKVVKINVDIEGDLVTKYNVYAYPTLIVIKNGEVKNQSIGVINKEQIEAMLYEE